LVPHNPKFCISSVPEFLQNLLAGDIPRPLKNASTNYPSGYKIFAKKLPLDGGFTLENRTKADEL
jgi:hypothetical protein